MLSNNRFDIARANTIAKQRKLSSVTPQEVQFAVRIENVLYKTYPTMVI